jgi:hypothetical protein
VVKVGEAVDHRHPRAAREIDDALVQEHARRDGIDQRRTRDVGSAGSRSPA